MVMVPAASSPWNWTSSVWLLPAWVWFPLTCTEGALNRADLASASTCWAGLACSPFRFALATGAELAPAVLGDGLAGLDELLPQPASATAASAAAGTTTLFTFPPAASSSGNQAGD